VRPESIRLGTSGAGIQNQLQGRIVFSGFVGNMTRYQLACGDAMLQAYDTPNAPHRKGDTVGVSFASSDALVFRERS
jgi:ABC-type Fe3+/spermidine/putrescine transport system ATPase subunit